MADPDTFRVSPSLRGLPRLEAPTPEDAGPKQMIAMGESIQRAGTVAGAIYGDILKEQNATRVEETLTEFAKVIHDRTYGENGWATLKGKNALDRGDKSLDQEVFDEVNERAEQLSLGLGNDAQRRIFKQRATAALTNLQGKVQEHVARESFTYRQEVLTGKGDTFLRNMAESDPFSDDFANARDAARGAYTELAKMQGIAEEALPEFLRERMTQGHIAAIDRMLAADAIDTADKYFNENRDDMTGEAAARVDSVLVEQRALIEGANIGEQIAGMAMTQNSAAAPQDVIMPVQGNFRRTGGYGDNRGTHRHGGVDLDMPKGTPIVAGAAGTVRVKNDPDGYGTYVDLKLDDGTTLRYAHLDSANVKDGDRVERGQVVAKSGSSGRSTGPHLHYEVIGADGAKRDPEAWHQGKPRVVPRGAAGRSLSDQLQELYAMDLPRKTEQEAERRIRSLYGAFEAEKQESEENLISSAFAEVDRTGKLSNATRSKIVAAGLGGQLTTLRNFEEATNDRKNGGTVDATTATLAYGQVYEGIATGKITSVDQVLQYKPFLTDEMALSLTKELQKPQGARVRADSIITTMNEEIAGSGLFVDEYGNQTSATKKEYQRFVGAVTREIQSREDATGKPLNAAEQRQIILGMVSKQVISATGNELPGYAIRNRYDNIPRDVRMRIIRGLQRNGVEKPSQGQVVSAWMRMQ